MKNREKERRRDIGSDKGLQKPTPDLHQINRELRYRSAILRPRDIEKEVELKSEERKEKE